MSNNGPESHDPFSDFRDKMGPSLWLGAPLSSRRLREFGRALNEGLDGGAHSFERSRDFIGNANDRIVNKSIGILQFNAVLLAVIVLLVDHVEGVNSLPILVCAACVTISAFGLLLNMHLYTIRDISVYADPRRHFFQQLSLFKRRARYHSFGLWLSVFGLFALAFAVINIIPVDWDANWRFIQDRIPDEWIGSHEGSPAQSRQSTPR